MGRIPFILLTLVVCQLVRVDATVTYINCGCVDDQGNFTKKDVYQQNLNLLFSNLSSQASVVKFYNYTAGDISEKVYGLYQCREDLSLEVCGECIHEATQNIVVVCPLFREAVVWYHECMLRYASRSIFSLSEESPQAEWWMPTNVSNLNQFATVLANTFDSLINDTAFSTPAHFATREANLSLFSKLYSLAQCTPDLNRFGCNSCLSYAESVMAVYCNGSTHAIVFLPSCQLWYGLAPFYNVIDKAPPALPSQKPVKKLKPPAIAGIAVAASVGMVLLVYVIWLCLYQVVNISPNVVTGEVDHNLGDVEFVQYDFTTMRAATADFSIDNKLGEGGFGVVYKGTLKSGQEVAIKRLSSKSAQGPKEFRNEAHLVAKLQHRNLVKLLGFCSEGEEKLLIYEFMPNTSLDRFLFDLTKRAFLQWDMRYRIILGIARGLHYLHEDSRLTIIHRDLKTSNILLDREMNPKIADFGIAKLFGEKERLGNTSQIVGTHGYMAPEYVLTGEYSDKSDVYSFGVIVLEIVSGQKNKILCQSPQRKDLLVHAWQLWNEDRALELIDPTFQNIYTKSEVMRCIQVAMLCVQGNAVRRPTMAAVMLMLTGPVALPSPSAPSISLSPEHFNVPTPNNNLRRARNQQAEIEPDDPPTIESISSTQLTILFPR